MTTQEKARFFYQFAALLNGMTVQQSLNLAGKDCNPSFRQYLSNVGLAVGGGQDLASAIAVKPQYFDNWTVSLIRLAEYSGALPEVCQKLAIALLAEQRRKRLYRSVKLGAIALIWSLLLLVVAIFKQHSSGFLKTTFWLYSLGLLLLLVGVSFLASRYPGTFLQRLSTGLPGWGRVAQARSLLYFAELELPLSCGIPIITALDLVREHIPDSEMRATLASAARKIRAGQTLTDSLQGKIPPLTLQMIRTGEETGNLDAAFQKLTEYYASGFERSLRQLQGILRPLIFLTFGSLVAVLGIRVVAFITNSV